MGEMNDFRYHPLRITAIVTLLGIGAIITAALERAWWELTLIAVLTLYNLAAGYLEAARDYWRDRALTVELQQRLHHRDAPTCNSMSIEGDHCHLNKGHGGAHMTDERNFLLRLWS